MGILSRTVFREVTTGALLGTILFTFVLFLQRLGRFFEQLVNSSGQLDQLGRLFLLLLPPTLTFTIPVGVLVGVLIAMGRMSGDGEIVALRAAGVPSRRLLLPVMVFATAGFALAVWCSCVITPWATRETYRILNQMVASQLTAEIRPRIFEEQFPNRILYVDDLIPGPVVRWKGVFLADLRPPGERDGAGDRGDSPRITLAKEAVAVPDIANNRIQLALIDGSSFEVGKSAEDYYTTNSKKSDQALDAPQRSELKAKDYSELDMAPLYEQARKAPEAAIEFHRRLALPVACILLGMLAVPLGVTAKKGGKSAAFVLTVALGLLYYMGLISMIALARQGSIPAGLGVWLPNIVFGCLALVLLARLERASDRDWTSRVDDSLGTAWRWLRGKVSLRGGLRGFRIPLLPQMIDTYVLSSFLYYFAVLLASFVFVTHIFTFFELLGDIIRNGIPMPRVGTYHMFLTPKLIYDSAPMGVLVAVLVTFGIFSKSNEVTAMKACGVSLYRLSSPVLVSGLFLSATLFAFDYYVVPEANLIQDAIRNEIKGRPVQTYLRPDRKWIVGRGPWIYYYKHFDAAANVMVGVNVYHFHREPGGGIQDMRRHLYAENARWEPGIRRWVFQNGWTREFQGIRASPLQDFHGATATFSEYDEPPNHFLREVKQDSQMNFHQLEAYIGELRRSGFDTVRLEVQYQKKFSIPIFAAIMALISIPFAFFTGNRGAMAPVGISLGIAICYWVLSKLFEQMGNVGQLPAPLAAWSPDVIFSLAGTYFLMRVRT
jgi:LPS export ABC transporter permease LptG/LPS export ABC transporter permease LptF